MKTFLIILSLLTFFTSTHAKEKFIIAIESWPMYSEENGHGIYHEIFKRVFKDSKYEAEFKYAPYVRTLEMFRRNEADAVGAVYKLQIQKNNLIPKWHMGVAAISVFAPKGKYKRINQNTIKNKKVAWVRAFNFDKIGVVKVPVQLTEVTKTIQGYKLIESNRVDFFIDYSAEFNDYISKGLVDPKKIQAFDNVLFDRPYYLAVKNNQKGKEVIKLWDQTMQSLHRSGELEKLWMKYIKEPYNQPPKY